MIMVSVKRFLSTPVMELLSVNWVWCTDKEEQRLYVHSRMVRTYVRAYSYFNSSPFTSFMFVEVSHTCVLWCFKRSLTQHISLPSLLCSLACLCSVFNSNTNFLNFNMDLFLYSALTLSLLILTCTFPYIQHSHSYFLTSTSTSTWMYICYSVGALWCLGRHAFRAVLMRPRRYINTSNHIKLKKLN